MSRAGVAMQQVGYQTGDFLVQVQSGQSAMVAFGQQATQMVGALYMLPAATLASSVSILGLSVSVGLLIASLGIIIPLLTAIGAAYLKMKKANDKSADAVTYLDGKLKSLTSTLEDYKALQEAIASGVSLDELFANRGIEKAKGELAAANKELEEFSNILNSSVGVNSVAAASLDITDKIKSLFGADVASKYEAAVKRVISAETVLAEIRQKEADTRADNFADSSLKLKQELELLQAQADFGKDSPQSVNKELEQELRNRKSAIDARVVAGELDANAAATLKLQVERAAALLALVVSNTAAEERKAEAIKLSYEYSQRQADLAQEQKAAVEAILNTVEQETSALENQLRLNQAIFRHGKDSVEVKALEAKIARDQVESRFKEQGILGNNLNTVMALYDANVSVTGQIDAAASNATDLAGALKEAAAAMASLSGFSNGLDKALAVSVAKVQALKSGTDAAIAGSIAGMRIDLEAKSSAALAAGADPIQVLAEKALGSSSIDALEESETQRKALEAANRGGRKGKSGGGSGGSNRDSQLDSFISSLMTERETLEQWRSEQVDLLGQFNETELEIIGGHAEAKLRLEQEYSDKLVALKASESQVIKSQSSAMYSALGGFLDQFAGKSKAAAVASVALNKALSIAQAIQNTSVAYTKALIMDPTGAMASRVAMLGKIQVGLIAATGLSQAASAASGGASGTVSGSASGAAATMPTQTASATPQRVIIEGIDRDSLFSGEQLSKIFEAIYEENENRGMVFEVAR